MDKTLHVLTDEILVNGSILDAVQDALAGGADVIQLRAKTLPRREVLELAVRIREMTSSRGAIFIVNDYLDIALMVKADGVHLGQEDLPYKEARELSNIVRSDFLIGLSARNLEEAIEAEQKGADYIGFGPVFPTATKADASQPQGIEELRKVMAIVRTPIVAIGGIGLDNVDLVLGAGCSNVAVISAVVAAEDPRAATQALKNKILG